VARLLIVALALGVAVAAPPARAQTLDPASSEALAAALRMLTDPGARGAAIGANPSAGAADKQIQSLGGSPALTQQLYELAGQIFEDLARGSGGDATKMAESLQRAQSDPAGFAALLSPRTLDRLRDLATKISDQRR
jgi:hypothetical protein